VLELAAAQMRILVGHDRRTMIVHFRNRLSAGRYSPGVFLVSQFAPTGPVAETLLAVWAASEPGEWVNQIRYLPSLARHVFAR
jgi:hypothetical protein